MSINEFIECEGLQPADAVIIGKKVLGMVDHYALFMGFEGNRPIFVANYHTGVQVVPDDKMRDFLQKYDVKSVLKFPGPENQRGLALMRAWSRVGEKAYSFIANNCEHFIQWVHHGVGFSTQVKGAGDFAQIAGAGVTLVGMAKKKSNTVAWGLGILALGMCLGNLSEQE